MATPHKASDVVGAQDQTLACLPLLCGLRKVSGPPHPPLPLHRAVAQPHQLGEAWGGVVGSGGLLQAAEVSLGLGASRKLLSLLRENYVFLQGLFSWLLSLRSFSDW